MSRTMAHPDYAVELPGLADAVADAAATPKHSTLVKALQAFAPLARAKLIAMQDGCWLSALSVIDANGVIVATDHATWLADEVAQDDGAVANTYIRLKNAGHQLVRTHITRLYLLHDNGGPDQANALQVTVNHVRPMTHCRLFQPTYAWSTPPQTLDELLRISEGELVAESEQRDVGTPFYALTAVIDVAGFVATAERVEAVRRAAVRSRTYRVTELKDGRSSPARIQTHDELHPGWDREPVRERRWFDDWAASSAGRCGARAVDHWALQCADATNAVGERWISFVPVWGAIGDRLPKVQPAKKSDYRLMDEVQRFDARLKVPFGWFFYMLHGNRIEACTGRRLLAAAEQGLIVLTEDDYRVLKRWEADPYGF